MRPDSNAKVGRNDPCPCGSGKKYKRCCLEKETGSDNPLLFQAQAAQTHILRELGEYLTHKFRDRFVDAWQDFAFGADEMPDDPEAPEHLVFMHYALFHWDPDFSDEESTNLQEGGIVARSFLQHRSYKLTELDRSILKLLMTEPMSFYEVLSCRPGEGFRLRDLWTENEYEVTDPVISEDALPGDIFYAQLLSFSGITLVSLTSAAVIPAEMKPAILEYREVQREADENAPRRFSKDDVRRQQEDLRELYLEIGDVLNDVGSGVNTDGEPLALHTLTFEVSSAEEAFHALAPLATGLSKEDLLADARFNPGGKIASIEFPWLEKGNAEFKSFDDTILGMFCIKDRILTVETNSESRAAKVRKEIAKRLGAAAVHQETVAESYDDVLEKQPERWPANSAGAELLQSPEAQRAARELLQKEVDGWASQKIPALGNRTPLDAVKDPETRETVELLVRDYERTLQRNFPPNIRPDINGLRKILQL